MRLEIGPPNGSPRLLPPPPVIIRGLTLANDPIPSFGADTLVFDLSCVLTINVMHVARWRHYFAAICIALCMYSDRLFDTRRRRRSSRCYFLQAGAAHDDSCASRRGGITMLKSPRRNAIGMIT